MKEKTDNEDDNSLIWAFFKYLKHISSRQGLKASLFDPETRLQITEI